MGLTMSWPAVFLDRDGVINQVVWDGGTASSPRCLQDFVLLPGVVEASAVLRDAGFLLVVFTNQPDIARGKLSWEVLETQHLWLRGAFPFDDILVCPHDSSDQCRCRKPLPGMILESAKRLTIDLSASWTVGDRWVDVAAGQSAGTRTVLIETTYGWKGAPTDLKATEVAGNLLQAAELITALAEV